MGNAALVSVLDDGVGDQGGLDVVVRVVVPGLVGAVCAARAGGVKADTDGCDAGIDVVRRDPELFVVVVETVIVRGELRFGEGVLLGATRIT